MFILQHAPLNHIWRCWLLSCPSSPGRHPLANVKAMLCLLVFRMQQGFVHASLLGTQKHTAKCFKVSSTATDTHDTPSKTQKSWKNAILSSASPVPSIHQFCFGSSILLLLLLVLKGVQSSIAIPDSLPLENR